MNIKASADSIAELSWLSEVEESGPVLNQQSPIWVRHFVVGGNGDSIHPERHPYCELGMHFTGRGIEYVERENAVRQAGDLFLAGPGVPHWFVTTDYPLECTAIYFLPSLLCEMGPVGDGFHILRRFTARQDIDSRLVRPPEPLRRRLERGFRNIRSEFDCVALGREIRLRSLLMDMLVDLMRWESRSGREMEKIDSPLKWRQVNQALHYLREHFAEPVYAYDVARAVGVSESRLKTLFREALGMPWSRYIQGYRIQQAVALLNSGDCNISEAAQAVGFESLSHFNATFRAFMGLSPSAYLKSQPKKAKV